MIGNIVHIKDIELDLQELVLPANLLAEDEEIVEAEEVEPPGNSYRIVTCCVSCHSTLRLWVFATSDQIRVQQELLLAGLGIICPGCAKSHCHHGGEQR